MISALLLLIVMVMAIILLIFYVVLETRKLKNIPNDTAKIAPFQAAELAVSETWDQLLISLQKIDVSLTPKDKQVFTDSIEVTFAPIIAAYENAVSTTLDAVRSQNTNQLRLACVEVEKLSSLIAALNLPDSIKPLFVTFPEAMSALQQNKKAVETLTNVARSILNCGANK